MSGTIDKSFRPVVKQLRALGYTVEVRGGKHPRVLRPNGTFLAPLPTSSSDVRSLRNFKRQLSAHGVSI